jgi:hypothetical protein
VVLLFVSQLHWRLRKDYLIVASWEELCKEEALALGVEATGATKTPKADSRADRIFL